MKVLFWMQALLATVPAAYAWWSGRAIQRSIDDPALPELLLARQRRLMQVTLVVIIATVALPTSGFAIAAVLGVLAAQYPVRRSVYGDTWTLWQYLRFTTFSTIAFAGLWLFPLIASAVAVQIARAWVPSPSTAQTALGFGLGIAAAVVYLIWHRHFVAAWLALHHATLLDGAEHASLLARFEAVLDRAGSRLAGRPTIHRYGAPGGQVVNAAALCSLPARAVAMSDALLAHLDEDEATAIFAHEIAHHEHYDTALLRKRRRSTYVLALLMVVIPTLQLMSGDFALAIDFFFLVAILVLFARGQRGHREHETASDLRAVDLTGDADAVIRALTKIHALARMPRRFSQELERAATHPSLARRIQAIRAHAAVDATPLATPSVFATTAPGAWVALDDARSHWFEGVPDGTAPELAALRERATSYRALAHGELGELRLEAERPRTLRATDVAGRTWSVGIRDEDVALVQMALDAVDTRFGAVPAQPSVSSDHVARTIAAGLLLATMLGGLWGVPMLIAAINAFTPSAASLAAMAVLTIGQVVLALMAGEPGSPTAAIALVGDEPGAPYVKIALGAAVLLAIWSAWIAWRWSRTPASHVSPNAAKRSRVLFAILALGVVTAALSLVGGGVSSPAELAGNPGSARVALAVLGLGAALLALRARAQRRAGLGIALTGLMGFAAGLVGERFTSSSSTIAWTTARLSLVTTVPMGRGAHDVELSPAGTRFLTRHYDEEEDDENESIRLVTGSIPLTGPTRTVKAIDAALPNESELLVLDRTAGDSLELRLERQDADSASRVLWRRTLPTLTQPRLELRAHGVRWLVSGRRFDGRRPGPFVTIAGDSDGNGAPRLAEVPGDSLYAQTLYTFGDGATLAAAVAPLPFYAGGRRSMLRTYLWALRGTGPRWTIFRYERDGSRRVGSMGGYPLCAGTVNDDAAVCVERQRRTTRMWSIARTGDPVDLGALSSSYVRASASPGGRVVASSNSGRSVAIVDVARRRGVRTSLPSGDYDFVNELTATDAGVAAVLGGRQGMQIAVYRFDSASAAPAMVAR